MKIILACVIATAGSKTASAQLSGSLPAEREAAARAAIWAEQDQFEAIRRAPFNYIRVFDPENPRNPFPGKSYRDLTAEDFRAMPKSESVTYIIRRVLKAYVTDNNSLSKDYDAERPDRLTREQYFHLLLREARRRGALDDIIYFSALADIYLIPKRNVTISRPLDVPPEKRQSATIPGEDAAFRDLVLRILQKSKSSGDALEADVKSQLGVSYEVSFNFNADIEHFYLGYLVGSNPLFFNGRQASRPAGRLPLSLGFNNSNTEAQLLEAYCAIVPIIVNSGHGPGVDGSMAVSAGFIMAREDARDNFVSNEVRLGFNGALCPTTPPVWDPAAMGAAISGIDLLPE